MPAFGVSGAAKSLPTISSGTQKIVGKGPDKSALSFLNSKAFEAASHPASPRCTGTKP